jgi:hypothetical protein
MVMENDHKSLLEKIEALEKELHQLITRPQQSLAKIRQLGGLLPICASCKKIRDDKG